MSKYIRNLIDQGEHQELDFKFEIADSRKIARTLVAFANTNGGKLLVGVKDNGSIAGVRSDEEFFMIEAAASMYSRPEVAFITKEWEIDGKIVFEVSIPKSSKRPHFAPYKNDLWKAYVRVDDQNILANSILMKVWARENNKYGVTIRYREEEKILLDYLKEYGKITYAQFCKIAKIRKNQAETILVNFIVLNIIEMVITEKQVYYKMDSNYG